MDLDTPCDYTEALTRMFEPASCTDEPEGSETDGDDVLQEAVRTLESGQPAALVTVWHQAA